MSAADILLQRMEDEFVSLSEHIARRVVLQLFINAERPLFVGSGFFLSTQSAVYLVSAKHVFDQMFADGKARAMGVDHQMFFYVERASARNLGGRLLWSEQADVGVMRLAGNLEWSPDVERVPVPIQDTTPAPTATSTDWFALIGFPVTRTEIDSRSKQMLSAPFGLALPGAAESVYEKAGLSISSHILVDFDVRKPVKFIDGSTRQFPKPQGMSGAPLWSVRLNGFTYELGICAIATTHIKGLRAVACARIEIALAMIEHLESE